MGGNGWRRRANCSCFSARYTLIGVPAVRNRLVLPPLLSMLLPLPVLWLPLLLLIRMLLSQSLGLAPPTLYRASSDATLSGTRANDTHSLVGTSWPCPHRILGPLVCRNTSKDRNSYNSEFPPTTIESSRANSRGRGGPTILAAAPPPIRIVD